MPGLYLTPSNQLRHVMRFHAESNGTTDRIEEKRRRICPGRRFCVDGVIDLGVFGSIGG